MFLKGEIIGQFNLGFIIARLSDNDLFIVDQHATDEKFRYEEFLNKAKIVSQPLVCPQNLDLDPGKKEILRENITVLEDLGFGLDIGENCKAKLTKVPHCDRLVLGKKYVIVTYRHQIRQSFHDFDSNFVKPLD